MNARTKTYFTTIQRKSQGVREEGIQSKIAIVGEHKDVGAGTSNS